MELELANELKQQNGNNEVIQNARMVLMDEKMVAMPQRRVGDYDVFYWPGFRLMISKDHECLMIILSDNEFVTVSVGKRVHMNYVKDNVEDIQYSYNPFVRNGCKPLVYFTLFLWYLSELEGHRLKHFLLGVQKSKPFTTHFVFSPKTFHQYRMPSSYKQVQACCDMYKDIMADQTGDFNMSTELEYYKPWKIRTEENAHHYLFMTYTAQNDMRRLCQSIRDGINIPSLCDAIQSCVHMVNEGYFLFEEALLQNRPDIATWLWIYYGLDPKVLKDIIVGHPYNKVVEFVYSLFE